MGVGHAHLHRLETADAAAELLTLTDVGHGPVHLLGADAQLQGRQGGNCARCQPIQGGGGQHLLIAQGDAAQVQVGNGFAVGHDARYTADARLAEVHQDQPGLPHHPGQY
ncbi:hypothetical protein D3C81_2042010 [compost metagenome]